jgi:hypothetical protein
LALLEPHGTQVSQLDGLGNDDKLDERVAVELTLPLAAPPRETSGAQTGNGAGT